MAKSSPMLRLTYDGYGFNLAVKINEEVTEKISMDKVSKGISAIISLCKRYCLRLIDKHSLIFQFKQQVDQYAIVENEGKSTLKNKEKNRYLFIRNMRKIAKSGHRRSDSDGFSKIHAQKPLKESNQNCAKTVFSTPEKNTTKALTNKSTSHFPQSKPAKREFPINNLSECLLNLHKKVESNEECSENKSLSFEKTQIIQSRVKYLRCKEIFERLQPNKSGFITKDTIKLSTLANWQTKILTPLLSEMTELEEKLNFEDFFESMNVLFASIPVHQCEALLKNKSLKENSIYERSLKDLRKHEVKIVNERLRKTNDEYQNCSFQPWTLKSSGIKDY